MRARPGGRSTIPAPRTNRINAACGWMHAAPVPRSFRPTLEIFKRLTGHAGRSARSGSSERISVSPDAVHAGSAFVNISFVRLDRRGRRSRIANSFHESSLSSHEHRSSLSSPSFSPPFSRSRNTTRARTIYWILIGRACRAPFARAPSNSNRSRRTNGCHD